MYNILPQEQVLHTVNTTTIPPKKFTSYKYGIYPSLSSHQFNLANTNFHLYRAKPAVSGLKPNYYTRHHPTESKRDTLVPIIAPIETFPANSIFVKEGKN